MKKFLKIYFLVLTIASFLISFSFIYYHTKSTNKVTVSTIVKEEKIAYLTFDDGPSKNTDKILEILAKYNIKATFFVTGPSYYLKDTLLRKIANAGHEIAIHSYEHNYNYIYSSKDNYLNDFEKCQNWIKEVTSISPSLYRFPGGSSNTIASRSLIKKIIDELEKKGYVHADWNVDTLDSYSKNDTDKIINNALSAISRNENNNHYYQTVLMHDDINKSGTLDALPAIIEKLAYKGYSFKTLNKDSHIIKHVK